MDTPSVSQQRVTELPVQWSQDDDAALAELTPLVYDELRRVAHHHLSGQRPDHTLQTTALVNEAYLRLADQTNPRWQSRALFFAVAARAMRQILVSYARSQQARKRGGGAFKVDLGRSGARLIGGIKANCRSARSAGTAVSTRFKEGSSCRAQIFWWSQLRRNRRGAQNFTDYREARLGICQAMAIHGIARCGLTRISLIHTNEPRAYENS
jgi:ECF sigma factor